MNLAKRLAFALALAGAASQAVAQNGYDGMRFVDAVRDGKNSEALELLRATPTLVNARDNDGETALFAAVSGRDAGWTGHLLQNGADPNLAARNGDTPLIAAARIGFMDAAEALILNGAKVDEANRMGETPLIIAVQQRSSRMVKLLLDQGADPDRTDSAAGLSARDYAKRDTRSRDLIRLIEAKKPTP